MPKVDDIHQLLRRYAVEMGVDPQLIDVAARVSADRVRYLSRDDVIRYGLDTSVSYETRWTSFRDRANRVLVIKSVRRGANGGETWTGVFRLWCVDAGPGVWFTYQRELLRDEPRSPALAYVNVDPRVLVLSRETIRLSRRDRGAITSWDFLEYAMTVPTLVITEVPSWRNEVTDGPRVFAVSTEGLPKELAELKRSCTSL
jgi:hypothetical protein